jgi:tripartite-type tricarboxylate transporter receptor subunit TctC
MNRKGLLVSLILVLMLTVTGVSFSAPAYPEKAIELIVPWAAGGTSDLTARGVAKALEPILGQSVIVSNVLGASGAIGHNKVRQTAADGYTLLLSSVSFVGGYYLGQYPFNWQEFDPLCTLTDEAVVVVVNGNSSWKSLKDLIQEMKARPGQISWAYTGSGNSTHLAAEGVRMAANANFRGVPYNGGSEVRTAILGGHVDVATITGGEAWSSAQAGKLRILATSLPKKSPSLPGVPTFRDQGVKFDLILWKSLFVPKGTPAKIKSQLCSAINKAMKDPEFVKLMETIRSDVDFRSYDKFGKFLVEQDQFIKDLLTQMNLIKK